MALAPQLIGALNRSDLDGALALCDPAGTVVFPHLDQPGTLGTEGRAYVENLLAAFPDLRIRTRHHFVAADGTEVAEINVAGTQAADFLGIVNQEKFCDLDQAWRLTVDGGRITGLRAFWDHAMLLRRLGVRRLDNVTITEEVGA